MLARLKPATLDAVFLFTSALLLGVLARWLAMPTWDYLVANLAIAIFLLPTWLASRYWLQDGDSPAERVLLAAVAAFTIYGVLVVTCFALSLGFDWFYALFAVAAAACLRFVFRSATRDAPSVGAPQVKVTAVIALAAFALFAVQLYKAPYGNDLWQFMGQTMDMQMARNFEVSLFGVESLGLNEAMPRYKAHLVHAFFAVMADTTGISSVALKEYLLTIPLGLLILLALMVFVRSVVGTQAPFPIIALAVLAPITLFWNPMAEHFAYDYSFRLLNSPSLDKDFTLFFILPGLLFTGVRYLKSGRTLELSVFTGLALISAFFHPMLPVYLVMSSAVLLFAFFGQQTRRASIVVLLAGAAFTLSVALEFASSYHDAIDAMVDHDSATRPQPTYWIGHYASVPGQFSATIGWFKEWMYLRPNVFLFSSLLVTSSIATVIWAWILWRRRKKSIPPEETIAFKMQVAYLGMVGAIFALAPIAFYFQPHLYRGYERLHWMYFGFFSLVYLGWHTYDWVRRQTLARNQPWPVMAAVGYLAFTLHMLDQSQAMYTQRPPLLQSSLPLPKSLLGTEAFHVAHRKVVEHAEITASPDHRATFFTRPDWLQDDDRVLDVWMQSGDPQWYWLQKQSVHWPELYGEAKAYADQGDAFLSDWDAYRDARDHSVTDRLIDWLDEKQVTVIVTGADASRGQQFAEQTARKAGKTVQQVAPGVFRLAETAL